MWEGGPELHTPGRATGAKGSTSATSVCREPTGMQSLISWKPRAVEVANICTEARKVPRNQGRGLKLDKVQLVLVPSKHPVHGSSGCWQLAWHQPSCSPWPALPANPSPTHGQWDLALLPAQECGLCLGITPGAKQHGHQLCGHQCHHAGTGAGLCKGKTEPARAWPCFILPGEL